MIVAGASSYPRLIDYRRLAQIASDVSAYLMVDMAHIAGLVAAQAMPSPVPHADFVTFTTYKTLMGGRGGIILCKRPHAARVDRSVFPGCQGTPSMNMIAAKAVSFLLAKQPWFRKHQRQIIANAGCMAETFAARGYRLVSGGTDNHLVLIDLRPLGLTGNWVEKELEDVGLIVNRNPIPNDEQNPKSAGGLRLGTPAITVRGMKEAEVRRIVEWIDDILSHPGEEKVKKAAAREIARFCRQFPLPR
jgi:glycine hydroxymethyltransferase